MTVIRCAYLDLIGAKQAHEQMDIEVHDWDAHDLTIAELETEFPFVLEPVHADKPISKYPIDPDDAPDGYIAVPYTSCDACGLGRDNMKDCDYGRCFPEGRKDEWSVQFELRTEKPG
jgi:hypothetical protein